MTTPTTTASIFLLAGTVNLIIGTIAGNSQLLGCAAINLTVAAWFATFHQ